MTAKMTGAGARVAVAARAAADGLHLAAAPAFAVMALVTGVLGAGPQMMLCRAGGDAPGMSGMVCMYLLMSAFHAAPWLRLFANRLVALPAYDA